MSKRVGDTHGKGDSKKGGTHIKKDILVGVTKRGHVGGGVRGKRLKRFGEKTN